MGQSRHFAGLPMNSGLHSEADMSRPVGMSQRCHQRKCTCASHTILRSRLVLLPLLATIHSLCVYGGLDSIDPDQRLADTLEAIYGLRAGHGYDGAADSRDRGR
jgi:hypothetical protein